MKKLIFFSVFLIVFIPAQELRGKSPLDHHSYDIWQRVNSRSLSNDGSLAAYSASADDQDPVLELIRISTDERFSMPRGDSLSFSENSRFALFLKRPPKQTLKIAEKKKTDPPADTLIIFDAEADSFFSEGPVKKYALPKKSSDILSWIALLQPDSSLTDSLKRQAQTELCLFDPLRGDTLRVPHVRSVSHSEDGRWTLWLTQEADSSKDALVLYDREDRSRTILEQPAEEIHQTAFSEQGAHLAWISSRLDSSAGHQRCRLSVRDLKKKRSSQQLSDYSDGIPSGRYISRHGDLLFSRDGESLYFGVSPLVQDDDFLKDQQDSLALEINVQVWHYRDPFMMTQQLKDRTKELKRSEELRLDLKKDRIVVLGSAEMTQINYARHRTAQYAAGIAGRSYAARISWDWPQYSDLYLLDLRNGDRTLLAKELQYEAKVSPGGRYIYWWDRRDSSWQAYDTKKKQQLCLSASIPAPLSKEHHDWAFLPDPAGDLHWDKDDRTVYIPDTRDLWAVDPLRPERPENITASASVENLRFRIQRTDSEEDYVQRDKGLLLQAFNPDNKNSGYYLLTGDSSPAEVLMYGPKRFRILQKAENAQSILFTREDSREFPDLRSADLDIRPSGQTPSMLSGNSEIRSDAESFISRLKNEKRLTELNPQQSDYNWLTAELRSWSSLSGETLQGILYKPEDFDPDSSYPLIVYFYERNSDNLHRHSYPAAHRSIINFAFYASRGYLIFVPDISYTVGHPGASAFNAVMPAVTQLAAEAWVDEQKMALQGHSWGGYQIAWLITRTDRFAAAAAGAPVSNMSSAYGGIRWETGLLRQFQYEKTQSRIGASLWEEQNLYLENSPLFYADRISTPLLIMHNDKDGHVPWTQGIELFAALRRLEKPVWLINYSGEPHWPLPFEKRRDWALRLQQYFDHFLKDSAAPAWIQNGIPATEAQNTLGY